MLKIALIDDEKSAREMLKRLIMRLEEDIEILFEANSVQSARLQLQQQKPDLVLLDLMLTDGTGFDLLEYFPEMEFQVIFTTAHDQFALRAFEFHALDYLLKPIDPDALWNAVQYAAQMTNLTRQSQQLTALQSSYKTKSLTRLFLPTADGFIIVKIADIIHLQGDRNYTDIYTSSGKVTASKALGKFSELLPSEAFFRIHQSHLIRLDAVTAFHKTEGDQVELSNGAVLPVARRQRTALLERLRNG